ncbi:hypothetical protein [Corynebacterium pseudopelargi]|uniref:hypothetical protein n=1 Tax=Corynebacterium pseudopelargi TaxID=2080757 RepID=UPI000F4F8DAB|nr:hypothetical protein [Corynebacterium pseudopelargi]
MNQTRLTPELVAGLLAEGNSQSGIARTFGVSRQHIHYLAKRAGLTAEAGEITQHLPWDVDQVKHGNNVILQSLRAHARYRLQGLAGVQGSTRKRLAAFYRKITVFQQVVDFDPRQPPIPRVSSTGGFMFTPRTNSDGDYLIRIRNGLHWTEKGKTLWLQPTTEEVEALTAVLSEENNPKV